MPRSGGTMSIPNTLVAGETALASDVNENFEDIADELTNSVAVNGQSTLTGQLKAANGTVAAPGITFGSDTDTGLYRVGANNMAAVAGGVKVIDWTATVVDFPLGLTKAGVKVDAFPTNTTLLFHQTTAPTGWTKRTDHNDKALRVVSGSVTAAGSSPFSTVFGLTATSSYTLLTADIPAHSHTITDPGHFHLLNSGSPGGTIAQPEFGDGDVSGAPTQSNTTGITGTNNAGGGGSHAHAMDMRVQYIDVILADKDA